VLVGSGVLVRLGGTVGAANVGVAVTGGG